MKMDKKIEHTHENGVTHSHEGGDIPHTHDELPRIECTTITTYRNTKTGETYKEKKEGPDIVKDVTVQVTNKGLEIFQKVLNENKKPRS
jgi:hypothetical protein|tara:strand:- start:37 stop:303 length:267 start_codon:yes stop_codon:yes gene_type:complete